MIKIDWKRFIYDRIWFGYGYGAMYYYGKKKWDWSWVTK